MTRSSYRPHMYSNFYLYSRRLKERDPYFSKKLEELLIARAKLTKQQRAGILMAKLLPTTDGMLPMVFCTLILPAKMEGI